MSHQLRILSTTLEPEQNRAKQNIFTPKFPKIISAPKYLLFIFNVWVMAKKSLFPQLHYQHANDVCLVSCNNNSNHFSIKMVLETTALSGTTLWSSEQNVWVRNGSSSWVVVLRPLQTWWEGSEATKQHFCTFLLVVHRKKDTKPAY